LKGLRVEELKSLRVEELRRSPGVWEFRSGGSEEWSLARWQLRPTVTHVGTLKLSNSLTH
jgi:hypothetical protein